MSSRLIAALAALLITAPVYASEFAAAGDKNAGFYIVLTKEPCPADLLTKVKPEYHSRFHLAHEQFQGRELRACWALNPPVVAIIDEDGDSGTMPMSEFRPVQGI
jgi:hypothetical protein